MSLFEAPGTPSCQSSLGRSSASHGVDAVQVLDPFAVVQVGEASSLFGQHTAINEYSEQKLLQMYWQLF